MIPLGVHRSYVSYIYELTFQNFHLLFNRRMQGVEEMQEVPGVHGLPEVQGLSEVQGVPEVKWLSEVQFQMIVR